MSHIDTAYKLGSATAEAEFEKLGIGALGARMLAGGAVGAAGGAIAGGEGSRLSGALAGGALGAGAGAGLGAAMQKGVRGQIAQAGRIGKGMGMERGALRRDLATGGQYANTAAFPTLRGADKSLISGAPTQNFAQRGMDKARSLYEGVVRPTGLANPRSQQAMF